jgi:hypothetical protein
MCPTFHCSLTARFKFNCYSKYSRIIVNWFTVFLLLLLHCRCYSKKTVNQFFAIYSPMYVESTYIGLYIAKNVNSTVRLQLKVDKIKNCIYLQCAWVYIIATSGVKFIGLKFYKNFSVRCGVVGFNGITSSGLHCW